MSHRALRNDHDNEMSHRALRNDHDNEMSHRALRNARQMLTPEMMRWEWGGFIQLDF